MLVSKKKNNPQSKLWRGQPFYSGVHHCQPDDLPHWSCGRSKSQRSNRRAPRLSRSSNAVSGPIQFVPFVPFVHVLPDVQIDSEAMSLLACFGLVWFGGRKRAESQKDIGTVFGGSWLAGKPPAGGRSGPGAAWVGRRRSTFDKAPGALWKLWRRILAEMGL